MIIGLDVHKDSVYVTVMEKNGKIKEQNEMENSAVKNHGTDLWVNTY